MPARPCFPASVSEAASSGDKQELWNHCLLCSPPGSPAQGQRHPPRTRSIASCCGASRLVHTTTGGIRVGQTLPHAGHLLPSPQVTVGESWLCNKQTSPSRKGLKHRHCISDCAVPMRGRPHLPPHWPPQDQRPEAQAAL